MTQCAGHRSALDSFIDCKSGEENGCFSKLLLVSGVWPVVMLMRSRVPPLAPPPARFSPGGEEGGEGAIVRLLIHNYSDSLLSFFVKMGLSSWCISAGRGCSIQRAVLCRISSSWLRLWSALLSQTSKARPIASLSQT